MISTKSIGSLPPPEVVRHLSQSIAMLDAILMPEWQYRYYSFNAKWNKAEEMASMRNGSGDAYFILFADYGTIIKGYAHESALGEYSSAQGAVWPGVLDHVPPDFASFLAEPAFSTEETTFCAWWLNSQHRWRVGPAQLPNLPDPDGSQGLLFILDDQPRTYRDWAEQYYEVDLLIGAVERVYRQEPLNEQLVNEINPEVSLADLLPDIAEIGYPLT